MTLKGLIYRHLRRDQLCPGPAMCPQSDNVNRCPACPLDPLDEALAPWSALIQRCSEIRHALEMGFCITPADVTGEEFRVLRLLDTEIKKYEDERSKRQ